MKIFYTITYEIYEQSLFGNSKFTAFAILVAYGLLNRLWLCSIFLQLVYNR